MKKRKTHCFPWLTFLYSCVAQKGQKLQIRHESKSLVSCRTQLAWPFQDTTLTAFRQVTFSLQYGQNSVPTSAEKIHHKKTSHTSATRQFFDKAFVS